MELKKKQKLHYSEKLPNGHSHLFLYFVTVFYWLNLLQNQGTLFFLHKIRDVQDELSNLGF